MVDDSEAIKTLNVQAADLESKNEALETQEATLQAIATDEGTTDTAQTPIQQHIADLQAAKATTDATLNAANLKAELRATQALLQDARTIIVALKDEVRKHRQVLRFIKDNYTG
jgi:chromosome segregation ATPase